MPAVVSLQAASSGDLVTCPDFSAVYLIEDDGNRWVFPNEKTYFTWYDDFNDVIEITCDELASYSIGGNVTYKAGSRLLKLVSVPTVYTVEDDGVLRAIQSEAQAEALFGSDWAQQIDDLPDTFWSSYSVGDPIDDDEVGVISDDDDEVDIIEPELTYDGAYNGTLYATSEQIGEGYDIDDYMDNLDRNGVTWLLPFFSYEDEPNGDVLVTDSGLGYVINALQSYPGRMYPYYNIGWGGDEIWDRGVLGDELTEMYTTNLDATVDIVGDFFYRGIGEIETQDWNVDHDADEVRQLVDLADGNNVNAMFHPVGNKMDDVERLIEAYPDVNFHIHMFRSDLDKGVDELIDIMQSHDNLYYTINASHIIHYNGNDILYHHDDADSLIDQFDDVYDSMVDSAVEDYGPLVEAVPDKVMWGTEAGPTYTFEPEVYDRMIKISRAVIGEMPEEYQEGLAYENALEVFGDFVTLDANVTVYDNENWGFCENDEVDLCDAECGSENDADDEDVDDACFQSCLFQYECKDPDADED